MATVTATADPTTEAITATPVPMIYFVSVLITRQRSNVHASLP